MDKSLVNEALASAIATYPTLKAFAAAVGVRYQVVQQWLINGVPAEHCPTIEKITSGKVLCEDLNSRVDWAYIRASSKQVEQEKEAARPADK
jgi:DNA-binding transcriptional regulator YdaS (Cro superfamily)